MTARPLVTPMRDGSRNGSALAPAPLSMPSALPATCPVCAVSLPSTRARYCSAACRQRAFRLRNPNLGTAGATELVRLRRDLQHQRALVAHTVYECPRCAERYVGERRCPECHVFCRALGLGGSCPHCDQPILLVELVELPGKEVVPAPTTT